MVVRGYCYNGKFSVRTVGERRKSTYCQKNMILEPFYYHDIPYLYGSGTSYVGIHQDRTLKVSHLIGRHRKRENMPIALQKFLWNSLILLPWISMDFRFWDELWDVNSLAHWTLCGKFSNLIKVFSSELSCSGSSDAGRSLKGRRIS